MPLSAGEDSRKAFAHPLEAEFARLLDYYHIPWEYEPKSFPLEWDAEGRVTAAFTPDFYLPDQDLYVELTTLRPQLIRSKNRKLRRLRELYPQVNIRLLRRRDLRELLLKYGLREAARPIADILSQSPPPPKAKE